MRILVVSAILLTSYLLIGVLLLPPILGWIALAIPFVLIWLMPILFWNRKRKSRWPRLVELVSHGAFFSMGVISYLLVFSLIRFAFVLLVPSQCEIGATSILVATLMTMAIGAYRALRGPRVKRVNIEVSDLAPELDGVSIVQISDLHVGTSIRRRYVEKAVDQINSIRPDIFVMTGDIGDGDVEEFSADIAPLSQVEAKYGRYFATGNHEYYWGVVNWKEKMRSLGMQTLFNEGSLILIRGRKVLVAGVTDPAAEQLGVGEGPDVVLASKLGSEADFKILLSHRPGIARLAEEHGFDLQLSGHTHGGQFFPWTLISPLVHEFNLGLGKAGKMYVYVNSGTGTWGPQLRLGTTPEITRLVLRRV